MVVQRRTFLQYIWVKYEDVYFFVFVWWQKDVIFCNIFWVKYEDVHFYMFGVVAQKPTFLYLFGLNMKMFISLSLCGGTNTNIFAICGLI